MAALTPEQRQQAIRGMVEGLAARMKENPQDRAGWLRLANAWKVLGEQRQRRRRLRAIAPLLRRVREHMRKAYSDRAGVAEISGASDAIVYVLARLALAAFA